MNIEKKVCAKEHSKEHLYKNHKNTEMEGLQEII